MSDEIRTQVFNMLTSRYPY